MLTNFYRHDDAVLATLVDDEDVEVYLRDRQSHNFFTIYYLPEQKKHVFTFMDYYELKGLPTLSKKKVQAEAPEIFKLISIFEDMPTKTLMDNKKPLDIKNR